MINTDEILIVAAITVTTILLTIIGIQLIFILRDVRKIVARMNMLTGELEKIGLNMGHSYGEVVGFVSGMKKMLLVVDHISEKKKAKHEKK